MKKILMVSTLLFSSLAMTGCMGNGGYGQQSINRGTSTAATAPVYNNTNSVNSNSAIQSSLAYMYDEERLAKEVYLAIYQRQPVSQLSKIASKAEGRHIDAVKDLAQRYGVATPYQQAGRYQNSHIQSLYNKLYAKGIRSRKDALEVGCIVEVVDVDDLNNYISEAQRANAQDVVQTYNFLLKGSYNHYWAFDKGLKEIGVSSGCCSLGQKYCHPEYPQNEKGNQGGGQGRGQGRGWR
jgi:hypothetical protein